MRIEEAIEEYYVVMKEREIRYVIER